MSRQVIIDHYFGSPIFPFNGKTKNTKKKLFRFSLKYGTMTMGNITVWQLDTSTYNFGGFDR